MLWPEQETGQEPEFRCVAALQLDKLRESAEPGTLFPCCRLPASAWLELDDAMATKIVLMVLMRIVLSIFQNSKAWEIFMAL